MATSKRPQLMSAQLVVRLTPQQRRDLEHVAATHRKDVTAFIRETSVGVAQSLLTAQREVRCPAT